MPGAAPVSDDEEELPVPDPTAFVFLRPPRDRSTDANNHTELEGCDETLEDSPIFEHELSDPCGLRQEDATDAEEWQDVLPTGDTGITTANPKTQVVDYQTLGPIYTDEEAIQNAHTVGIRGTLNTILQMAYGKAYIPLSMLTTAALNRIRSNDNLKYVKVPNSAVKQTLNPSQFGSEDDLSSDNWDQAYSNWLVLLKSIAENQVLEGWQQHRDAMRRDEDFSRWSNVLEPVKLLVFGRYM